jgi:lipopolysaccharide cholinephosphotransferase
MKRPEKFVKSSESDIYIKNIQHCLLLIAKEIKRICEKNDIPYFMIAGTLLGAVRHKGFIPWDDDMDFGMFRADYERFLKACETDLNKELFFVQNINTDSGYGKFYTRLLLNNTSINYEYIKDVQCKKAIFVDIFPYDSIPESKLLRKKQSVITSFAMRIIKKKLHYGIDCFTLGGKIELLFEKFFTKKGVIKMYEKEMQRYNNNQNTSCVCCSNAGEGYPKETLKRKWLTDTTLMQFEDTQFPGSVLYDEYMSYFYGDYMTLPPENKRLTHEFEQIDFGPYKIYN